MVFVQKPEKLHYVYVIEDLKFSICWKVAERSKYYADSYSELKCRYLIAHSLKRELCQRAPLKMRHYWVVDPRNPIVDHMQTSASLIE